MAAATCCIRNERCRGVKYTFRDRAQGPLGELTQRIWRISDHEPSRVPFRTPSQPLRLHCYTPRLLLSSPNVCLTIYVPRIYSGLQKRSSDWGCQASCPALRRELSVLNILLVSDLIEADDHGHTASRLLACAPHTAGTDTKGGAAVFCRLLRRSGKSNQHQSQRPCRTALPQPVKVCCSTWRWGP